MDEKTKKRLVKNLQNHKLSLEDIIAAFSVEKKDALEMLKTLEVSGIPVDRQRGRRSGATLYHISTMPNVGNVFYINGPTSRLQTDTFAVSADWHIASKYHLPKSWHEAMKRTEDSGIRRVWAAGDIMDGIKVYRGHLENLLAFTVEDQTDMVAEALEKHPNLEFWGVAGNHDYCISMDAEVFTREGWKTYNELSMNDYVLTLGESLTPSFEKIKKILFFPQSSTELFTINGRGVSLRCTENHNIPFVTYNTRRKALNTKVLKFRTMKDFLQTKESSLFIPTGTTLPNLELNISDEILKLVAWILTDGMIRSVGKSSKYSIFQSKIEMVQRIRSLLEQIGVLFTESSRDRSNREIIVNNKKIKSQKRSYTFSLSTKSTNDSLKKLIPEKSLQSWMFKLSKRQFDIFLKELVLGDGSIYKTKNCYVLYGKESFLEDIQTLCHLFGYRATITQSNRGDFRMNICERTISCIRRENIMESKLREPVWCLLVNNHNFMVRHEGKISFTGNSFTQQNGVRPLAILEAKVDNFKNLGDFRADIVQNGIKTRLLHGGRARTYAKSYPSQTYLRDYFAGLEHEQLKDVPHIMVLGHFHIYYDGFDYGMHILQPGSFQDGDNEYCIRRGLTGPTGLWHIEIAHQSGELAGFGARWVKPKVAAREKGTMHAGNTKNYRRR